jgi:hypothetical protein
MNIDSHEYLPRMTADFSTEMFGFDDYLNSDPMFYDPELEPWNSNDELSEHRRLGFSEWNNL